MENKKEKGLLLTWKSEVSVWDYEKVYSEIQNGKKTKTTKF
jgi:mcrBC restriction endonuclease system mcrB subunit